MIGVLRHGLSITSFGVNVMLLIEPINVRMRGFSQRLLRSSRCRQNLPDAVFGVMPGWLRAFPAVSVLQETPMGATRPLRPTSEHPEAAGHSQGHAR
jgi:hypothetical protein